MKTRTFLFASLCSLCATAQEQERVTIHFASGSATLSSAAIASIDRVAGRIQAGGVETVTIAGHTDAEGSDAYNLRLSKARMKAVEARLVKSGIGSERVIASAHGEKQPLASNDDEKGMEANRRVELVLMLAPLKRAVEEEPVAIELPPAPAEDTVITGPLGTRLRMPKDAFCCDMSKVKFEIDEIPGIGEMILNNLPTQTADGQCLASGGVLRVRATVDGKEVQPCAGKEIEITIPADRVDPEMQVYELKDRGGEEQWVESRVKIKDGSSGSRGYTFSTPRLFTCNIDKVPVAGQIAGVISKLAKPERGLVVRSRKMDYKRSFLASQQERMAVRGEVFVPRKVRFTPCSVQADALYTGIFERDGQTYLVAKPLAALRYKRLGNRYVVRKRDYEKVTEAQLKARLLTL